jgi:hypothetical protein
MRKTLIIVLALLIAIPFTSGACKSTPASTPSPTPTPQETTVTTPRPPTQETPLEKTESSAPTPASIPEPTPASTSAPTPTMSIPAPPSTPTLTPPPSTTVTPTPTIPKPTLEDIVIKIDELSSGWQLFFKGKKSGGIREWDINNSVSRPIDELEVTFKSGDSVPKSITNYIIWCNKSDAGYYYKQLKELKDTNLTITDFTIGDGGFSRIVRGPRLELNQITNTEQFKDIVVKVITVCFTKGDYYVTISSSQLELASEKDMLSLLQNLARNVEKRITTIYSQ